MTRMAKLVALASLALSFACSSSNNPDGGATTSGPGGSTGHAAGSSGGTTSASSGGHGSTGGGSGGGSSGGGGSTGCVPFSQVATTYIDAFCQAIDACEPSAAYVESACATTYGAQLTQDFADLAADIDAGRLVYDCAAAAACIASTSVGGCDVVDNSPAVCDEVFVGQLPAGATCYESTACDAGYCTTEFSNSCPGVCSGYTALGFACGGDAGPCDTTAVCGSNGICVALGAAGASCQGATCQSGLSCLNGTCVAPGGAAAPCSSNDPGACQAGFYCVLNDGGISGSCGANTVDGGACASVFAGYPAAYGGQCAQGLVCAGYALSFSNLQLTATAGACLPPSNIGGACVLDLDGGTPVTSVTGCLSGLACIGGQCEVPPTSGTCAADPNAPCQTVTSYCDTTGNCQPKQASGATCNPQLEGNDCQSSYCDADLPDGGVSQTTGTCQSDIAICTEP